MIYAPAPEYAPAILSVADGTRPAMAFGASVTPNQNDIANATYASLIAGASVTREISDVLICVNTANAVGAARDCIVTIGIDPAGGSSYTTLISNLVCGPAGSYSGAASNGGPVWFRLPVRIPSGSSVGAKASVNSSTLTAINVFCELRGSPSHPARAGSVVESLGVTTASSSGTSVTPGTSSDGSYVEIGTLTRPCCFLAWGVGVNDGTMSNNTFSVDIAIGNASSKRIVVPNGFVFTAANEATGKHAQGAYVEGATGDIVYARMQCGPNASDSSVSVACYAVGG